MDTAQWQQSVPLTPHGGWYLLCPLFIVLGLVAGGFVGWQPLSKSLDAALDAWEDVPISHAGKREPAAFNLEPGPNIIAYEAVTASTDVAAPVPAKLTVVVYPENEPHNGLEVAPLLVGSTYARDSQKSPTVRRGIEFAEVEIPARRRYVVEAFVPDAEPLPPGKVKIGLGLERQIKRAFTYATLCALGGLAAAITAGIVIYIRRSRHAQRLAVQR